MKRILNYISILLVLVLVVNMLPMQIFAEQLQMEESAVQTEAAEEAVTEEAHILGEVTENRTEYSKEFLLSNGLHMAAVYAEPVHYEKDGQWENIDNTLKADSGKYLNTAGVWDVTFPQQFGNTNGVTITKDGYTLIFGIPQRLTQKNDGAAVMSLNGTAEAFQSHQATLSTARIEDHTEVTQEKADAEHPETVLDNLSSRLTYENIHTNTDVTYDLSGNKVKESIIIEQYDAALRGYSYTLNVGNMTPVVRDDGSIELYDSKGEHLVMVIAAPYLMDDNLQVNTDVEVALTGTGSIRTLTYTLPQSWLADENRQWPVILDPVVVAQTNVDNIRDATVTETNYYSHLSGILEVGYYENTGISRTYLKYNNLPTLTSADVIVNATIVMWQMYDRSSTIPVEVHKVNAEWDSQSITWANKPAYNEIVDDYVISHDAAKYTWNVTDIVREWYSTGDNTGMMFKVPDDLEDVSDFRQFYSSDYGTKYRPALVIEFRNNNGLEGYWQYTASGAGRAGTGHVNHYTGNMVWTRPDIGFDGNRMPVFITAVYNANDAANNSFGMGYGWRTNYNQRVYEWEHPNAAEDYYVWEDGDGTAHYFRYDDEKEAYVDEYDLEMTLTDTGSGSTTYALTDKKGNVSYFDSHGRLFKILNNQETKSSNIITYTTDTGLLIAKVRDGVGRYYNFNYNASNQLTSIVYTGTGSSPLQTVSYSYDSGNLTKVTYEDDKSVSYTYNGDHILRTATDVDGYMLRYFYTIEASSYAPYRVNRIRDYDGETAGGNITLTYGHNETTFYDAINGTTQTSQFNNMGNTISVQDDQGRAEYAEYAINNAEETGKANQLRVASQLQNTVANLINYSSFENGYNTWNKTGADCTHSASTDEAYYGSKSLKLVAGTAGTNCGIYFGAYSLAAGESITFSAYIKATAGDAYIAIGNSSTVFAKSEVLTESTNWTRLEVHYTAAEAISVHIRLYTTGTVYMDCVQVEKMATASRYNLLENGDFRYATHWSSTAGRITNEDTGAPQLSQNMYRINGDPQDDKAISHDVAVSGEAGDTYVLAGWAKANSVPIEDEDTRTFRMIAVFNNTDGTTTEIPVDFNPCVNTWQYAAKPVVAKKAYSSITVKLSYNYNANTVYFDGIQLFKEKFGNSYTYDDDDNIVSVVSIRDQKTTYEYTDNDLTKQVLPSGVELTYEYDDYHNVTKATSETGMVYKFTYDTYGNNTKVEMVSDDITISSTAAYTSNGNYQSSVTDALGNVTSYGHNADTGVLEWVKYPRDTTATRTNYTYDSMYRMAKAEVTTNQGETLSATYSYTDDLLTSIETEKTKYDFTYGDFSLRSKISIGDRTLAEYKYTSRNNYLQTLDYGNDGVVKYTYDKYGRMTKQTFEDGDTVTYLYDNDGALATVIDSATGRTTTNYYDFAGQLRKYVEKGADFSHSVRYTYDEINNLTALQENINGKSYKTSYAYDKDNRIISVEQSTTKLTYTYDPFSRIENRVLTQGNNTILKEEYEYKAPASGATSGQVDKLKLYLAGSNEAYKTYTYKYDDNGNIININDGKSTTYQYDSANQLIRENNATALCTYIWTYDAGGNILTRSKYPFTSASDEVSGEAETVEYAYTDSQWKDLLTQFDGKAITYDTIGNMLTLGNTESFTWEHGRELSTHAIPAEMAIITQPKDFKGVNDAPVEFSIKAAGEDLSYLWQISDDNGSTWSQSTAATYNTATLSGFTVTPGKDGRLYRCVVTDGNGNKRISSTAELSLVPVAITNQPNNFYGYEGKDVSFSLTASGENLTYKWQLSGNDGATWYDSTATGYNTNTLSGFTATEDRNGNLYRCIVTDSSGNTVTSNEVKLNTTNFAIYRQPSNAWGVLGDEVSFSVRTYSTTSVTYQWQYSSDGQNWINSPADGNQTNTLNGLKINETRLGLLYRCVVTDANNTVIESNTAKIRLKTDTWRHTYDANGMRTQRTYGNTTYKYIYNGGSLRRMTVGDDVLTFGYDASGKPMYVQWSGTRYFYMTNIQGDVVGLLDSSGSVVVTYAYDAWGNILSVGGDQADYLGKLNPLRYRGYVYDTETGLYYLQSRYYNPEMGRFINPDDVDLLGANGDFTSLNLFAYCGNNPVDRRDICGYAWETVFDIISLATSVAEVVANPVDPWAWAGLIGDVVDVAVPFVGGLGEAVDAVKTVSRVVDKGDDIIDAAKSLRRTADVADDIKDSTGTYVVLFEQGQHYIGKGGFNRAITSATEHATDANKVSALIWAPTPSKESAFVSEYLLQSVFGVGDSVENTFNRIWSPGKKLFNLMQ